MTLERYWATMLKQWKLVILCFIVAGLGAFVGSKLTRPIYQSTVLVQVALRSSSNQADINSLLASDQLVQTESQLALSNTVLREVAAHYKGMAVADLTAKVTSTPKLNTQLFQIDVQDSSPTQAAAIANDVAMTLIKQQLQITNQDNGRSQQQVQQDLDKTRQQIDALTTQVTSLQVQGNKQSQIAVLQAQINGLQQHYTQWQTLLAQLELTAAQSGDFLRIAQPAQPATSPIRPQVLLNTGIGLTAGLFVGMLLAVLFELLDTRLRTAEALTELIGLPVLATIRRSDTKSKSAEDLINPTGHSYNVESYRILRTNVGFSSVDKPLRTLVVTSAIPNEGKSTIASNLAIFMAKAGKSTLLIDADLRRPTIHQKFNLPGGKMGLSNAVLACSHLPSITRSSSQLVPLSLSLEPYMHDVNIPNLRVMPSGPQPPNPPELLDSKAMERFFEALKDCKAEIIVFDTPPLLGLSDSSILTAKVDGTLLVVDITHANKKNMKNVKALLVQAGVHVIGCVVNKERVNKRNSTSSYYYYYSQEHSPETSQKEQVEQGPLQPPAPVDPIAFSQYTNPPSFPSLPVTPDLQIPFESTTPLPSTPPNWQNGHAKKGIRRWSERDAL